MTITRATAAAMALAVALAIPVAAAAQATTTYRVLATNKTSTMQKELMEAGDAGYRFAGVMGGETSFGGKEVVVLMQKTTGGTQYEYRLLATSKTSTMQKELQDAADAGFEFVGQTVFESLFGGKEVGVIVERNKMSPVTTKYEYKLLATSKTSTLQKELDQVGAQGYAALAMTVGQTAVGGSELVVITRKKLQ